MINDDKKQAIKTLYNEGSAKKDIARMLKVDPKTVRSILMGERKTHKTRSDKKELHHDLVEELYHRCDGYMQRVHEILTEEHKINVGYSTLTRFIRAQGIGQNTDRRYHRVEDFPGDEMQHDTSPYKIKIGKETIKVICSALYFRYSKIRYVRFYLNFNRFTMKCFLHEALTFFRYSAKICVIDNTSLVVVRGTGSKAILNIEMIEFARTYGFNWLAHEKGHANRKAGEERTFRTINTSFLPGRAFKDIKDLNAQVFHWAAERYARRPQSRTKLIPVELFEVEKPYLIKLPKYIMPPYQEHHRGLDEYGYLAFNANYYWVPKGAQKEVFFIEYADKIRIFPKDKNNKKMPSLEYRLPERDIRNQPFKPDGMNTNPYQPRNRKKPSHQEEKYLRDIGSICCDYLDFIKSGRCRIFYKHQFIRELYVFAKKMAPGMFMAIIERALEYRVVTIEGLRRISAHLIKQDLYDLPENSLETDYSQREAYQQGRFSTEADIQDILKEQPDDEDSSNNG